MEEYWYAQLGGVAHVYQFLNKSWGKKKKTVYICRSAAGQWIAVAGPKGTHFQLKECEPVFECADGKDHREPGDHPWCSAGGKQRRIYATIRECVRAKV